MPTPTRSVFMSFPVADPDGHIRGLTWQAIAAMPQAPEAEPA